MTVYGESVSKEVRKDYKVWVTWYESSLVAERGNMEDIHLVVRVAFLLFPKKTLYALRILKVINYVAHIFGYSYLLCICKLLKQILSKRFGIH